MLVNSGLVNCRVIIHGFVNSEFVNHVFFNCEFLIHELFHSLINCVVIDCEDLKVLQLYLAQDNISSEIFWVCQCGFTFILSQNEVANMMAGALIDGKLWEFSPIYTYELNNYYKLLQILLQESQSLAEVMHNSMLTFIMADMKAFYVHVIYILWLHIILDNVIVLYCIVLTIRTYLATYGHGERQIKMLSRKYIRTENLVHVRT